MLQLILFWFKTKAAKAAREVLSTDFGKDEIESYLKGIGRAIKHCEAISQNNLQLEEQLWFILPECLPFFIMNLQKEKLAQRKPRNIFMI